MLKKVLGIISICFLVLGFFACEKMTISYNESDIVLYQNERYVIDSKKIVTNSLDEYKIESLNNDIAKVEGFVVYPKGVGNTQIRISLKSDSSVYHDVDIECKAGNVAKSISLDTSSVRINIGDSIYGLNKLKTNEDCDEVPVITYDSEIIDYNYLTGLVTAKKTGTTKVTIKYIRCETSFDVNVYTSVYTQQMIVEDCKVFANTSGKLTFSVFPQNANTYRFWTDNKNITIQNDGSYTANNPDKATIFYQYYKTYNNRSDIYSFVVDIVEKRTDFACNIQGGSSKFVITKDYTLNIEAENYDQADFRFSNNIIIKSNLQKTNNGYSVVFAFRYVGEQDIKISLIETFSGVESNITKTLDVNVLEESSIEIGAKWSANILVPYADGKYHVYLESDGFKADSIYLYCQLDGEKLSGKTDVYMVNEDTLTPVDSLFDPDEIGEYVFEVHYEGKIIGRVEVIVSI